MFKKGFDGSGKVAGVNELMMSLVDGVRILGFL